MIQDAEIYMLNKQPDRELITFLLCLYGKYPRLFSFAFPHFLDSYFTTFSLLIDTEIQYQIYSESLIDLEKILIKDVLFCNI